MRGVADPVVICGYRADKKRRGAPSGTPARRTPTAVPVSSKCYARFPRRCDGENGRSTCFRNPAANTTKTAALSLRGAAAVLQDMRHVLQGPVRQGLDVGHEAGADGRQGVLHARRHFGVDLTADETVGLERAQRAGQHLGRDVGYQRGQAVETDCALVVQRQEDEQGPLVAETGHDVADGAELDDGFFFGLFRCHKRLRLSKSELRVTC